MNVRFEHVFSELWGFALCDPATLAEAMVSGGKERLGSSGSAPAASRGDDVAGKNLLERYTATDEGERVADAGAVIPVMVMEPGYATIDQPTWVPRASSCGWVLHLTSGALIVCGLGYLASWDPEHPKHRRGQAEPGWYAVDVHLIERSHPEDDFGIEFVLRRVSDRPTRTAAFLRLSAP